MCIECHQNLVFGIAKGVGVVFNVVLDFDFTPILTFPHRGGRDNMGHIITCQQGLAFSQRGRGSECAGGQTPRGQNHTMSGVATAMMMMSSGRPILQ